MAGRIKAKKLPPLRKLLCFCIGKTAGASPRPTGTLLCGGMKASHPTYMQ